MLGVAACAFSGCSYLEKKPNAVRLDIIKTLPEGIDGCSCFYAETENQLTNREYILVGDLDSILFVSVDGQLLKLLLERTNRAETFLDTVYTDVFSNDVLSVQTRVKYRKHVGDEVWLNDCLLIIKDKSGKVTEKQVIAECGC